MDKRLLLEAVSGHIKIILDASSQADWEEVHRHAKGLAELTEMLMKEEASESIPERPLPQTYGDWVNLAEDMKVKIDADYEGDPVAKAMINVQLQQIAEETRGAEEAKRWLTEKAGELGIG